MVINLLTSAFPTLDGSCPSVLCGLYPWPARHRCPGGAEVPALLKLVRLEAGHAGTRQECEADTRFTDGVANAQLIKGSRICVFSEDHVGLVTIRSAPETRDNSHFVTFDIVVWP